MSYEALRGQQPDRAGVAAGTEFYAMSEVDELPAAGVRPPSLGEPPGPTVKVGRVLQPGAFELPSLDVPVLQMEDQLVDVLGYFSTLVPVVAEQVIEVPKVVCPPRGARTVLGAPQMADQLVEVPTVISFSSLWQRMFSEPEIRRIIAGLQGRGGGSGSFPPGQGPGG